MRASTTVAPCSLWPSSITTRIKTSSNNWTRTTLSAVFDPLPLQQGLRHFGQQTSCRTAKRLWPSSITTRIKTASSTLIWAQKSSLWPSSITTRIKTAHSGRVSFRRHVFDPLPLQQGLRRLPSSSTSIRRRLVFDPLPLQQGLRLFSWKETSVGKAVFDPLPLQQGLRHCTASNSAFTCNLRSLTLFHYNKD